MTDDADPVLNNNRRIRLRRLRPGGTKKDIHMMLDSAVVRKLDALCNTMNSSRAAIVTELILLCEDPGEGA